jgi:hypothetical protein
MSLTRRVERHLHAVRPQIQHLRHRTGYATHHECVYHLLHLLETAPSSLSMLRASRLFALVSAVVECARALDRRLLFLVNLAGHLLGLQNDYEMCDLDNRRQNRRENLLVTKSFPG